MSAQIPLAITPGEPAGIGPDLCVQLVHAGSLPYPAVFLADPDLLRQRGEALGLPVSIIQYQPGAYPNQLEPGEMVVHPGLSLRAPVTAGVLDKRNSEYVLATLDAACDGCMEGRYAALVTGPVHKGIINEARIPFTGHTEYLANRCGGYPVMMLATEGLRVALATTHVPLGEVCHHINKDLLFKVLHILHRDLVERFGLSKPRILVCGINPHAGEGGHLGLEEIYIIEPVLKVLREEGMDLIGPLPADTLFTPPNLAKADAVLAMYHDQGLPVLKHMGFGRAVNITLGLPIIRTSVDHGTALDLAGTGKADLGSLKVALDTAVELIRRSS